LASANPDIDIDDRALPARLWNGADFPGPSVNCYAIEGRVDPAKDAIVDEQDVACGPRDVDAQDGPVTQGDGGFHSIRSSQHCAEEDLRGLTWCERGGNIEPRAGIRRVQPRLVILPDRQPVRGDQLGRGEVGCEAIVYQPWDRRPMRWRRRIEFDEVGEVLTGEASPGGYEVRVDAVIQAEYAERLRCGQRLRVLEIEAEQVSECRIRDAC